MSMTYQKLRLLPLPSTSLVVQILLLRQSSHGVHFLPEKIGEESFSGFGDRCT